MDPVYQPVAAHRIDVRYHAVGVSDVTTDILGARSIVERYKGQPNAQEAVTARLNAGYDGCWVVALGINEVANQVVGGRVPLADRIDLIMTRLADQPSMWTTVRTIKGTGPYAAHNMDAWNEALKQACARYPSMRVYDWASEVDPAWYIPDQIHYSTSGYTQRADRIARALARAYPRDGAASGRCFVTSGL